MTLSIYACLFSICRILQYLFRIAKISFVVFSAVTPFFVYLIIKYQPHFLYLYLLYHIPSDLSSKHFMNSIINFNFNMANLTIYHFLEILSGIEIRNIFSHIYLFITCSIHIITAFRFILSLQIYYIILRRFCQVNNLWMNW